MAFSSLARVSIAHLPTPFEEMKSLARYLNSPVRLFVKRDDCTGLAFGGNKTRKLEYSIAAALAEGADLIVTSGDVQSNHVRQTAAAATKFGIEFHCVIQNTVTGPSYTPDPGFLVSGNPLLGHLLGANVHAVEASSDVDREIERVVDEARRSGRRPYVIPVGASDGTGSMGYAECARELVEQWEALDLKPSHLVLATGSAGTQAGILMGLRALGSTVNVVGMSVSDAGYLKHQGVRGVVEKLSRNWSGEPPAIGDADIVVRDEFAGEGYGIPTAECLEAIRIVARTEGLLLDPVYTGKAMAGLMSLLATDGFADCRDLVFLHTGGAPALFGYPDAVASMEESFGHV